MSQTPLLCLSLLGLSFPLHAQYDDLLKNPNISWVAEYTSDFALNPAKCDWGSEYFYGKNDLTVIQLINQPTPNGLYKSQELNYFFSQRIAEGIRNGHYACFEDEQLEIPVSLESVLEKLKRVDTIVSFDPETYEEKVTIAEYELSHYNILACRVRQVFYYDKTERTFGSRLLAIAPVVRHQDIQMEQNILDELKTIVWLKIDTPAKNWLKAPAESFNYIFETVMTSNAPSPPDFVLKKGRMDFLTLIVNEVAQPSHIILDKNLEPINPVQLQDYVQSTDTVTYYDPVTQEESIQIFQRNAIKDVAQISFVQQWFFDDRKRLFFNRVTAFAPMIGIKDTEGNVQYSKVLFYILMGR